jgi:hypothetical protein
LKKILNNLRNDEKWNGPFNLFEGFGPALFSSRSVKGAGLSDWCRLIIAGSDTSAVSLGRPLNTSGENLDFFYTTGTKPDYSDVYVYWVRIDSAIDSLKRMSKTDLQK